MVKKITLLIVFILYLLISLNPIKINDLDEEEFIEVEIRGEVEKEGIYTLEKGSSFQDLIDQCGLKETADISCQTYSEILYNGQIIVIDEIKEDVEIRISLNSASKEELMNLPGIGEKTAENIIAYRALHSFHTIEEIMEVKGIGEKKFEQIKEYLSL